MRAEFQNLRIIARRDVRHWPELAERFRRSSLATPQAMRPHFRDAAKTVAITRSGREQLEENLRRDREAQERHDAGSWQLPRYRLAEGEAS